MTLKIINGAEEGRQKQSLLPSATPQNKPQVSAQAESLKIIRVVPDGKTQGLPSQIIIEFDRPMIPLGAPAPKAEAMGIELSPAVQGHWHWLNETTLAFEIAPDQGLVHATSYNLILKSGLKSRDGAVLMAEYRHSFITPTPVAFQGQEGDGEIAWEKTDLPHITVGFTQPVQRESVKKSLVFVVKNKPDQRYMVDVFPLSCDETPPVYPQGKEKDPAFEARVRWVVVPLKPLPAGQDIILRSERGLQSPFGPEVGDQEIDIRIFQAFPIFKFMGIKGQTNEGKPVFITAETPQKLGDDLIDPLSPVGLVFTAPTTYKSLKKNISLSADVMLREGSSHNREQATSDSLSDSWSQFEEREDTSCFVRDTHEPGRTYTYWLPYTLKADQDYTISIKPKFKTLWEKIKSFFYRTPETNLTDRFGRKLEKATAFTLRTDHRKPNFELTHHRAVLEKNADSDIPLYVNNLSAAQFIYQSLTAQGGQPHHTHKLVIPPVYNVQFAVPMDIRRLLGGKSGAVYGALDVMPKVKKHWQQDSLFAQVTPYHVLVKLGHYNTLVWVTDFSTGKPVPNATVQVYTGSFSTLYKPGETLTEGKTNEDGVSVLDGTSLLDPKRAYMNAWKDHDQALFVYVKNGDDIAFVPLTYDYKIDSWRVSNGTISDQPRPKHDHIIAWGTTAQGLYHAGDTLQYKIYVRNQDNQTLKPAPQGSYALDVLDPLGKAVYHAQNLSLNEFGALQGDCPLPKEAVMGWYSFHLTGTFKEEALTDSKIDEETGYVIEDKESHKEEDNDDDDAPDDEDSDDSSSDSSGLVEKDIKIIRVPLRVLVTDFTPSPFKVITDTDHKVISAGQSISLTVGAKYHAGGAYTQASSRLTAVLRSKSFSPDTPLTQGFVFGQPEEDPKSKILLSKTTPLDKKGEHRETLKVNDSLPYGSLMIEGAVQDERGKYISSQLSIPYYGVDRFVGLKAKEWLYRQNHPAAFYYVVTDEQGNLIKDITIDLKIEHKVVSTAKVKGAGNAFLSHTESVWELVKEASGLSQAAADSFTFEPLQAGTYRLVATIRDTKGGLSITSLPFYVGGTEFTLWDEDNDLYMQIIPEKKDYKVGDTGRFLIKNPYPGATALITVERLGVVDHWVQTLTGNMPVIDVPIKPDYLPGFYLSVMVVSPRVGSTPLKIGELDLAKPTMRMGYLTVPIKDPYKEVDVSVLCDKKVYKPGDTVNVSLAAVPKNPKNEPEPFEFSVAVIDEAVLDLMAGGADSYNPYEGLYKLDPLDLTTYDLLTRLVGRQKFETKGANPGGDGGVDLSLRHLFKFMIYWAPSLITQDGKAQLSFTVPDNLTGWRVLAMAATPTDRFGLGQGVFSVNRHTEIRPIMPNQISEGDLFKAGFSVVNRTDKKRTLAVTIKADGPINEEKTPLSFKKVFQVPPYGKETVWMPIQTNHVNWKNEQENIRFTAQAEDDQDADALSWVVPVIKARTVETQAIIGVLDQDKISIPFQVPPHTHKKENEIAVSLSPSVISGLTGAFVYFKDYPYSCWEQRLSKALMVTSYQILKTYLPASFLWPDSQTLANELIQSAASFQAPNGGMCYFKPTNEHVDPFLSAYTALVFGDLKDQGYALPALVHEKLNAYLEIVLKKDEAPVLYSPAMMASVRAMILKAKAQQGQLSSADLNRFFPQVSRMSLLGKLYFLQALVGIEGFEEKGESLLKNILSQANETSAYLSFSEDLPLGFKWLHTSAGRENAVALETLIACLKLGKYQDLIGDKPLKILRFLLNLQQKSGTWYNTQENVYITKAIGSFSQFYEKSPLSITVKATVGDKPLNLTKFSNRQEPAAELKIKMDEGGADQKSSLITLNREGKGRVYYTAKLSYSLKATPHDLVNAGIGVRREYSVARDGRWVLLSTPALIKRGDLVKVDLFVSLPADRFFVVVNDPVAGGLEPLNKDLSTSSFIDGEQGQSKMPQGSFWYQLPNWIEDSESRWGFYHQDLGHKVVRFYSDYISAGNYHLSYVAQAIADGHFSVQPALAQEMYNPDVYGKSYGETVVVG